MSIRVKCVCGAHLLAAPNSLGKTVSCAVCRTTLFVPSGGLSVAKVQARDELQAWICSACPCGKLVPEPPGWAGKKTRCPWCSNELAMPNPKKSNVTGTHEAEPYVEEDSAAGSAQEAWSARSQLEEEIDVDGPLPDASSPSRALPRPNPTSPADALANAATDASSDAAAARSPGDKQKLGFLSPLQRRPHPTPKPQMDDGPIAEERKSDAAPSFSGLLMLSGQPGIHDEVLVLDDDVSTAALPSSGGPGPARRAPDTRGKPWRWMRKIVVFWHRGAASVIWRRPVLSITVAMVLLLALGVMTFVLEPHPVVLTHPAAAARDVYFYDVESGGVFTHTSADLPPVATPWSQTSDSPHGYRAYVFSCGSCTPKEWEVLYIESYSATARDAWNRYRHKTVKPGEAHEMPNETQGRFVADPQKQQWVPLTDAQARPLLMRPNDKICPENRPIRECTPEAGKSR